MWPFFQILGACCVWNIYANKSTQINKKNPDVTPHKLLKAQFKKKKKTRLFNNHLSLPEREQGFPWELNFNIWKNVPTHLHKHINERNCMVFMFISIAFPNIARLYETIEARLPFWIDANSTFVQYLFLVVLMCCSRHLRLTVCEVWCSSFRRFHQNKTWFMPQSLLNFCDSW